MALKDMLNQVNRDGRRSVDTSEDNVMRHMDKIRQAISYWRMYPDRLVDYYCSLNPKNSFHLTFSQRIYLRASFRHRYLYGTFTRGFSKSFIAVLSLMLKAILYPGCSLFMTSDVKSQSAGILSEKVSLLCKFIPAMENEIIWDTRGANAKTTVSKDVVSYCFKNGSKIENLAAAESSRGKRYNGGIIEECAKIDGKILSSVVIPTMNVERDIWGKVDPDEKLNRSQIYMNLTCRCTATCNSKPLELLGNL